MILARLRRFRALAALLVVLSPPVAGTAIPVLDPCPVDMPWLAGRPGASAAHAGHGASTSDDEGGTGHGTCHCLRECAAGHAAALPSGGPTTIAAAVSAAAPRQVLRASVVRLVRLRYLTPPTTAPPTALLG